MVKFFFTGLLFWGIFLSPTAQNNQRITNFGIIKEKVDSNRFKMQYTIIIRDSIAAGYLPYFGSGYSIPQTGNRGIVFSNTMQDLTRQTRGKGRRQSIFYQFSVVGKNDTYKLSIDIRHDGTCYLFINSLKRSPISYTGQIVEQG